MGEPVVYVSTWKIQEGRFEDFRRFNEAIVRIVAEQEPRVATFLAFANDDGTEITNVHVFADQETLDRHMGILAEKIGLLPADVSAVTRLLEPVRLEVYGSPSQSARDVDASLVGEGVPFVSKTRLVGGFTRPG
jgi:hypothetical protein